MKRLDERGETLVEVVMALGILSLVLVTSYALATGTFRLGRGAGERTQAVNYLQQQAEALRTYRNQTDWGTTFVNTMSGLTANGATFCMKLNDTDKKWLPVASSDPACSIDDIKLTIASPTTGNTATLYEFKLSANWKLATEDNEVTITTKLAKQD
jgi:Tfp pilus assembly protein PilV